jgi:hypothetical protein
MTQAKRDMCSARLERLRELTTQQRCNAASSHAEYSSSIEHTFDILQARRNQNWDSVRQTVVQDLADLAARTAQNVSDAHRRAVVCTVHTAEQTEARKARHAATMRAVQARHNELVRQMRASKKEASSAKDAILSRRRAIFSADRAKAREMTALRRRATGKLQRASQKISSQVEAIACYAQLGECVSGTRSALGVPCEVRCHSRAGADGHGASVQSLVDQERQAAAQRHADIAESKAVGTQLASVRHRKALAEVQATAALPALKATLAVAEAAQSKQRCFKANAIRVPAAASCQGTKLGRLPNKRKLLPGQKPSKHVHAPIAKGHGARGKGCTLASTTSGWHPISFGLPPVDDAVTAGGQASDMSAYAKVDLPPTPPDDTLPVGFFKDDANLGDQASTSHTSHDTCCASVQPQVCAHGSSASGAFPSERSLLQIRTPVECGLLFYCNCWTCLFPTDSNDFSVDVTLI